MTNRSNRLLFACSMAILMLGCSRNDDPSGQAASMNPAPASGEAVVRVLDETEKQAQTAILSGYLALKDALANDDDGAAAKTAQDFVALLDASPAIYGDLFGAAAHEISVTQGLDPKRLPFEVLSTAMIELAELNPVEGVTLYRQSCPMVGDGSADWLSLEEEVLNPYHGDRMLHCGFVVRTI
jgi:hypothetical protein